MLQISLPFTTRQQSASRTNWPAPLRLVSSFNPTRRAAFAAADVHRSASAAAAHAPLARCSLADLCTCSSFVVHEGMVRYNPLPGPPPTPDPPAAVAPSSPSYHRALSPAPHRTRSPRLLTPAAPAHVGGRAATDLPRNSFIVLARRWVCRLLDCCSTAAARLLVTCLPRSH